MSMDEAAARRVILAHAIETVDTQGKLLSEVERDQIDREARQEAGAEGAEPSAMAPSRFLDLRARRVLQAVEGRNPALAALQDPWPWQRWLAAGLPLGAMILGVLTDVVANPHRVDLVSLPLLGLVLWNLFMYLLLLAGWALSRGRPERPQPEARRRRADSLLRWRRGSGNLRADVTALFQLRWQVAARGADPAALEARAAPVGGRLGRGCLPVAAGARPGGGIPRRAGKAPFWMRPRCTPSSASCACRRCCCSRSSRSRCRKWPPCSSARAAVPSAARAGSTCMSRCCWSWWWCRGWCWPRGPSGRSGCWRARCRWTRAIPITGA